MNIKTICLLLFSMQVFAQTLPVKLKCEYSENPLGLDVMKPRLSWQMQSANKGAKQTAYQILVATTEDNLKKDNGDAWNSGKILSDQSLWIEYLGKPLQSRQKYFWKVKIWDEKAKPTAYSQNSSWEMGLKKEDWTANWIGMEKTEGKPPKAVELYKEFSTNKRAMRARIYVTGLGAYHIIFNGKKVGNDYLSPGWTNYLKTLHYQTYDVTDLMDNGANFITATVGNAWWSGGLGWNGGQFRYSEGPNRLLFQLEITFYDGTIQTITSNQSWKARLSPITFNNLYDGETYDAQLEYSKDWQAANLLDDAKNKPFTFAENSKIEGDTLFSTKNINLVSATNAPQIQMEQELKAINITEPKKGHFVFDFGQNIVGIEHLKVEGKAGKEITMKFAELIDAKGLADQANLRSAKATDKYILKGYGKEEWEPKFTYHGFRYVEVTGLTKPDTSTLKARVLHSATNFTGNFNCSEVLLNKIWKNITWGQRGNMMSVPTDCPQRDERLGWMGDAQIFAPTAAYNMNMDGFFAKWEKDITDSQHATGYVYDVNPKIVVGGAAKPAWGDAVVIIPYQMYKFYGDKRIIEENYEGMKAWVEYMNNHNSTKQDGIYHFEIGSKDKPFYGYGDWVPVEKSPSKPIGGLYQFYSNKLLSEMAKIIGKTSDGQHYADVATNTATKYNELYFNKDTKQYEGGTQGANLMPLTFGITNAADKNAVLQNIINDVKKHDNHLTTGFLSTEMLLPMLSDNNQHELAYQVATQKTYPSWGYMVQQGATTMWELWNSDKEKPEQMNSRNHFAYGSVGEWYFTSLLGIRTDNKNVAFKKIIVAPKPASGLTMAEGSYETNYGTITEHWEAASNKFSLTINIPANTSAEIHLPLINKQKPSIKQDGKALKTFVQANNEAVINILAGKYLFEVE